MVKTKPVRARPIIRNPEKLEVTDAFGEWHTETNDKIRGVNNILNASCYNYFRLFSSDRHS
jgi:hypothetical protein